MFFDDDDKLKLETRLVSFPHPFHTVSLHFKIFHQYCGSLISSLGAGWFLNGIRGIFFSSPPPTINGIFSLGGSRLQRAKFCPTVAPKRVMQTSDNYFALQHWLGKDTGPHNGFKTYLGLETSENNSISLMLCSLNLLYSCICYFVLHTQILLRLCPSLLPSTT